VGDGKYGGKDAFLTGTISRKMHLHARRLRIDHPDGTPLDVMAELPRHFAESLADLGFEEVDGDLPLDENVKTKSSEKAFEKRAATAYAKDLRKARRGERRGRSGGGGEEASGGKGKPPRASAGPARPGKPGRSATGPAKTGRPGRAAVGAGAGKPRGPSTGVGKPRAPSGGAGKPRGPGSGQGSGPSKPRRG
jgi:23S rRNA pseudouridine955/2504/2580 synthase